MVMLELGIRATIYLPNKALGSSLYDKYPRQQRIHPSNTNTTPESQLTRDSRVPADGFNNYS